MSRLGFGLGKMRHTAGAGRVAIGLQHAAFGATFTFSELRPVGRYANGDWWVLGPVTITSISPASFVQASGTGNNGATPYTGRSVHGAMVNPGNRVFATGGLLANNTGNSQTGFDSLRFAALNSSPTYNAALNVDPGATGQPLAVTTGSVVKFVSRLTGLPSQNRPAGLDMVVLTVVDAIPAADAIRPGVSGSSKASRIRLSDFNLGVFQNLAPTASAPTFAEALGWVSRYIETSLPDDIQNTHAKGANNQDEYTRETNNNLHRALLCLHLSSFTADQKRQLLAGLATIGEDIVSRQEEGAVTLPDGGGPGWKFFLLVTLAASLGAKTPAAWTTYITTQRATFAENTDLFRVTPYDAAMPRRNDEVPPRPKTAYTHQMLGSVEWTGTGRLALEQSGANWPILYRNIVALSSKLPGMLAVDMTTGGRALYNYPEAWLYYDTVFVRRNETDAAGANPILPFPLEMVNAYRPANPAVPAIIEAGVRGDAMWLRFSTSLLETATAPDPSAFAVLVNGAARTVTAVSLFRQNIGLSLASPVAGTDVVTISYTVPGSNPARSADAVSVPAFSGQAVTNRTEKVGGSNTAFPVVRFAPGVQRTCLRASISVLNTSTGMSTLAAANSALGTIALMRFRFSAIPTGSNVQLFGGVSGTVTLQIFLTTGGQLQLSLRNAAGAQVYRARTPALTANTDYDVLWSIDAAQTTFAAGFNCFINGAAQTLVQDNWSGGAGAVIGWARDGAGAYLWNAANASTNAITFDVGAFWLNATTRVDITSPAERAKFAATAIGSRGDGVTGAIPAQFHVGNAAQWNDDFGMNRGVGPARFFPNISTWQSLGNVTAVSGSEWV